VQAAQVLQLPRLDRHVELPGAFEVAVDATRADRRLDRVEVGRAQALQQRHLAGPARQTVAHPVGQAGRAESTIAPRRGPAKSLRLEHHDLALGIFLQGEKRRPQAGESPADNREIDVAIALKCSPALGPAAVVPPQGGG